MTGSATGATARGAEGAVGTSAGDAGGEAGALAVVGAVESVGDVDGALPESAHTVPTPLMTTAAIALKINGRLDFFCGITNPSVVSAVAATGDLAVGAALNCCAGGA